MDENEIVEWREKVRSRIQDVNLDNLWGILDRRKIDSGLEILK